MVKIYFKDEYVTLNQFLKMAGVVDTGGAGKALIVDGKVCVNDEREIRRGRKLRKGDTVKIDGYGEEFICEKRI